MLSYCLKLCTEVIENKGLREKILRLLVRLYSRLDASMNQSRKEKPDYISVCQVLIYLNDPSAVSDILRKLLSESKVCKREKVLIHKVVGLQETGSIK